ncbi:MAG: hypothetical protein AMJ56_11070 [Anaerolineae bacterium SG8_19]|nr:MAG: hypothetical protein AMJ56_11070 [Anaerolineae bacterium SG8_19]
MGQGSKKTRTVLKRYLKQKSAVQTALQAFVPQADLVRNLGTIKLEKFGHGGMQLGKWCDKLLAFNYAL